MDDRPTPLPAVTTDDLQARIAELAVIYRKANGPVISLVNRLSGSFEKQLGLVPQTYRTQIEQVVERALSASYRVAGQADRLPDTGPRGRLAAVMAAGAAGGAGGLATAIAELPLTITLILNAIRQEARAAGFDPDRPDIRAECLRTFGAGSPLAADDGINTSFLSARLTLTGPAVQRVIATVAPRLAAALGQKLAAQAVPVLGAISGAALNAAFLGYYRDMARIRFQLLALAGRHGPDVVLAAFKARIDAPPVTRA